MTADTLTTCPSGLTERPLFAGSAPGRVRGSSGVGGQGFAENHSAPEKHSRPLQESWKMGGEGLPHLIPQTVKLRL